MVKEMRMRPRIKLLSRTEILARVKQYFSIEEFISGGAKCWRIFLDTNLEEHYYTVIVFEFKGDIPIVSLCSETIGQPEYAKALMLLAMCLPFETAIIVDGDASLFSAPRVATSWAHISEQVIYDALERDVQWGRYNEAIFRDYIDAHVWRGER